MRKLLAVSVSAPPKTGAESIQTARYLKFLSKYFEITLVTSFPTNKGWKKLDTSLNIYNQYISKRIELENYNNLISKLYRYKFFKKWIFPDTDYLFIKNPVRIQEILEENFDIIYSRSLPISSAMLAYKIKSETGKPWIAHFSDPWYGNPYYINSERRNKKILSWENKIIQYSNKISLTSPAAINLYKNRYPDKKDKFFLSPNIFDPEISNSRPVSWEGKMKIAYIGNLYRSRNLLTLLRALSELNKNSSELSDHLEVIIAGHMDESNIKSIRNAEFPNLIYKGPLNYNESLSLMNSADVLLSTDKTYENPIDLVFFPSKLLDYYNSKRLILGISAPGSPTSEFIKYAEGKCFEHKDHAGLSRFLRSLIIEYLNKNNVVFEKKIIDNFYSAEYQAKLLYNEMLNLIQ